MKLSKQVRKEVKILTLITGASLVMNPMSNRYLIDGLFWAGQWAFVPLTILTLYLVFLFGKYYNRSERTHIPSAKKKTSVNSKQYI